MIKDLEGKINYIFQNKEILEEALSHPSLCANKRVKFSYERLELLGDSILSLVVTEKLLREFPNEVEGVLAQRRNHLVCGKMSAKIAKKIGLGEYLIMGKSEEENRGRENENNLENAMEALLGAIYLDGRLENAQKFISMHWGEFIKNSDELLKKDPKTALQEWTQERKKCLPEYKFVDEDFSIAHDPLFTVELHVPDMDVVTEQGKTKKQAMINAASVMMKTIDCCK